MSGTRDWFQRSYDWGCYVARKNFIVGYRFRDPEINSAAPSPKRLITKKSRALGEDPFFHKVHIHWRSASQWKEGESWHVCSVLRFNLPCFCPNSGGYFTELRVRAYSNDLPRWLLQGRATWKCHRESGSAREYNFVTSDETNCEFEHHPTQANTRTSFSCMESTTIIPSGYLRWCERWWILINLTCILSLLRC